MRFKVTSIGGWGIRQGGHSSSGWKQTQPAWYVLDSANCFHVVREFRVAWRNKHGRSNPEQQARAYAAELERDYP